MLGSRQKAGSRALGATFSLQRHGATVIAIGLGCIALGGYLLASAPVRAAELQPAPHTPCPELPVQGGILPSSTAASAANDPHEIADLRESLAQCQAEAAASASASATDPQKTPGAVTSSSSSAAAAAEGPASGVSSSSSSSGTWMTIVLPSVSRGETDYLTPTISSILAQIPKIPGDPIREAVRVVVVDNTPKEKGTHDAFVKLQDSLKSNPNIRFHVQPKEGRKDEGNDKDHANKPGGRVRRQTRDLVYTLRQVDTTTTRHVFVMEDDFYFCPHTMEALMYIIQKAYRMDSNWLAMKVSYGFNGILLPSKDVGAFASYLEEHLARRPPDHLQTEWWAGETPQSRKYKNGRSYFVFRYNLLEHIGVKSSLRSKEMVGFGVCGQEMNTELMFEVDAFNARKCGSNDMGPCDRDKAPENRWQFMANPQKKPRYSPS